MKKIMFLCLSAMVFGLVACEKERQKAQVYDEKWYSAENYPLGSPNGYMYDLRMKSKTAAFVGQLDNNEYMRITYDHIKKRTGDNGLLEYKNSGSVHIQASKDGDGWHSVMYCEFVCNDVAVKFIKFKWYNDPIEDEKTKKYLEKLGFPKENTDYLINWDKIKNIITINGVEFVFDYYKR